MRFYKQSRKIFVISLVGGDIKKGDVSNRHIPFWLNMYNLDCYQLKTVPHVTLVILHLVFCIRRSVADAGVWRSNVNGDIVSECDGARYWNNICLFHNLIVFYWIIY